MIRADRNAEINEILRNEYYSFTVPFLTEWSAAFDKEIPPSRINEFGIIDEKRYDTDKGVLFVCKETNNWDNEDYEKGILFRGWMEGITQHGLAGGDHISQHPNMWYNIGRWATLICGPSTSIDEIADMKASAISAIGMIAFTNINKVRGKKSSRNEYHQLAKSRIAGELLRREVEIIKPQLIVCCGTYNTVVKSLHDYEGQIIKMPHPGARKKKTKMLYELLRQITPKKEDYCND